MCADLSDDSLEVRRYSVAIPASVISDTPHLREKTAKLGTIARATSIFGVSEIVLYADAESHDQEADVEFCVEILRYLETPQYLRKRMFKLNPMLKFTGILPPLQAPHHNVPRLMAAAKIGDVREGLVISRASHGSLVEVGLEKPISVPGTYKDGERITIRLTALGQNPRGETIEPAGKPKPYWGYKVRKAKSLGKLLNDEHWHLRLGTSRYGNPIQECFGRISKDMKTSESTIIAFGSPKMGLKEILAAEDLAYTDVFDYFVNTVPSQETTTVRTEEAMFVSLGVFNLALKLREGTTAGVSQG